MTSLRFNQPTLKTFDSFLENLFNDMPATNASSSTVPAVNICETQDQFEIDFNVPGRKKEDFKITMDKNLLSVSFQQKEEKKDENKQFIKKEFSCNSFKRSFTLDEKIDTENIDAKYEDGILKVILPKKEEVKVLPKEITVK